MRSEVSNVRDGAFVSSGTTIEGNWIHSLAQQGGDHNDLLQMVGGSGVVIRGNRLEHTRDQTAAIMVKSDISPIDDVRGSAAYRRHALGVLARRSLAWAWSEL